jgi:N-acetylmuramoyl-L-alanine amidase
MVKVKMMSIEFLTIHCAATPEFRDVKAAQINEWDKAKFGQTSYHWVIELDGKAVRGLPDGVRGAHVGRHNTGNIGICYVGGVDAKLNPKDTRTKAQKETMKKLVQDYQKQFPKIKVLGHREWAGVAKACPSFSVSDWLKAGMPT